jgi:hypothetical protein
VLVVVVVVVVDFVIGSVWKILDTPSYMREWKYSSMHSWIAAKLPNIHIFKFLMKTIYTLIVLKRHTIFLPRKQVQGFKNQNCYLLDIQDAIMYPSLNR